MSFVPAAIEIGEALAAKNITTAEATLGTAALEGLRYGITGARKAVTRSGSQFRKAKNTYLKKIRARKRASGLKPKNLLSDFNMQTESEAARFGEAPGVGITKQKGSGYGPGGNLLNTLYEQSVSYPTKGEDINQRPNDLIFLKGIKYCANFKAERPGYTGMSFVNFALVSRKENVYSNSDVENNLFRSREDTRGQSFIDTGEALDRHCLPINTDKFHVWTHKRFKLRGLGTNMPGSKMLSGYLPINRQIRFDAANRPNGEILAIWWYGDENTVATLPVAPVIPDPGDPVPFNTNIMFIIYWDNPVSVTMLKSVMSSMRRKPKYKRKSKSRGL